MRNTPIEWSEKTKWCTACKQRHPFQAFGKDRTRYDGLAACCLASKRVKVRKVRRNPGRRGWLKPMRDGDKLQARRRINYLVEQGLVPPPDDLACRDCGHFGPERRHQYDHYLGYAAAHHLDVEALCEFCHIKREMHRGSRRSGDSWKNFRHLLTPRIQKNVYQLRQKGEANTTIMCACGCGTEFLKFDSSGRSRKFISGHNLRDQPDVRNYAKNKH
jgi:hypothetical protein